MGKTLETRLTDAAIRRHFSTPEVREIRDPRYPIRFRYHGRRASGSWHVVRYRNGKAHWRKLGNWPALTTTVLIRRLPDILATLEVDPQSPDVRETELATLGEVFAWYRDRRTNDRQLSKKRKRNTKSMVNKHLIPTLGALRLDGLTRAEVDERLIWKMQADYAPSTVRQVLAQAKVATRTAHQLGKIPADPLAGMTFRTFIDAPIRPKEARLKPGQLRRPLRELQLEDEDEQLFVLLMMMHGTRITETRIARIEHFDLAGGWWHIPGRDTKNGAGHRLPLSSIAVKLLRAWQCRHKNKYTGYLFPGLKPRQPISERTASEIILSLSHGQWSSHDLRKAARLAWTELGIEFVVGEKLLNHTLPGLGETYIQGQIEPLMRDALQRYHEWLYDQGLKKLLSALTFRRG